MPSDFDFQLETREQVNVTLTVDQAITMGSVARQVWQQITSRHIRDSAQGIIGMDNIEAIDVDVQLTNQFETEPTADDGIDSGGSSSGDNTTSTGTDNRRGLIRSGRKLQHTSMLTVIFDVVLQIRTNSTDLNLGRYIGGAFDEPVEQDDYVVNLRLTGLNEFNDILFVNISEGQLVMRTQAPQQRSEQQEIVTQGGSSTTEIGISIGLVLVGVSTIGLLAYFLLARRRFKDGSSTNTSSNQRNSGDDIATNQKRYRLNEIHIDGDADISTLGEPFPMGDGFDPPQSVSIADTFSLDYDMKKAGVGGFQPSLADVSHQSSNPTLLSQDDGTLGHQYCDDETFEVEAPAGMLGLILHGSGDGIPAVHAIKPESPLYGQVRVGDRLLTVDGEDVTTLLSIEVSRLIASKRDKPTRRFVFRRKRSGSPPTVDDPIDQISLTRSDSLRSTSSPSPDRPISQPATPVRPQSMASIEDISEEDAQTPESGDLPLPPSLALSNIDETDRSAFSASNDRDLDVDIFRPAQKGPATLSEGESSVEPPKSDWESLVTSGPALSSDASDLDTDLDSTTTPGVYRPAPSVGESQVSDPILRPDDPLSVGTPSLDEWRRRGRRPQSSNMSVNDSNDDAYTRTSASQWGDDNTENTGFGVEINEEYYDEDYQY